MGKAIFCRKVKRRKKEHEAPGAEDEAENDASDNEVGGDGRAFRQKGWWKRGDVEAKLTTVNMTAWVHKECDIIEEEALTKLQEAQCGRTVSAMPSENKRGGLNCRKQEQQRQGTGQNACGIATINTGCRRRGKERRHQRAEVSKMKVEYGLPPPRRIKQRRDRKMAKKQVYTMATAEEVAPGSDWHFSVRTADGEVSLQENSRVCPV